MLGDIAYKDWTYNTSIAADTFDQFGGFVAGLAGSRKAPEPYPRPGTKPPAPPKTLAEFSEREFGRFMYG